MNYFRAIQGAINGDNEKDIKVAIEKRKFASHFDGSIGVVYDATRNGIQQDFIITSLDEDGEYSIYTRPDEEINLGDIIYWNKLRWLVVDKDFNDVIHNNATIIRCNKQIQWQNLETQKIIKKWCSSERPVSGINESKIVTVLNGQYNILLPYDNDTISVSIGKRFMVDIIGGQPICYKLVDVKINKYPDIDGGIIEWRLESDEYQVDNDNIDLMICNYKIPANIPETNDDLLTCKINGRNEVKVGYSRTYNAIFYDSDNIVITENIPIPTWTVSMDTFVQQHVTTNISGDILTVTCDNSEDIIGREFTITLSNSNYNSCEIKVWVVSAF